jgi:hypothetical protein
MADSLGPLVRPTRVGSWEAPAWPNWLSPLSLSLPLLTLTLIISSSGNSASPPASPSFSDELRRVPSPPCGAIEPPPHAFSSDQGDSSSLAPFISLDSAQLSLPSCRLTSAGPARLMLLLLGVLLLDLHRQRQLDGSACNPGVSQMG